jgi:hypothetical protein
MNPIDYKTIDECCPDGEDFQNWVMKFHIKIHPKLVKQTPPENKVKEEFPNNQICRHCEENPIVPCQSLCRDCFLSLDIEEEEEEEELQPHCYKCFNMNMNLNTECLKCDKLHCINCVCDC